MSDPRLDGLARLLDIVDRLRAPDGCPWDRKQTLQSMSSHLLEEAYELVDALETDRDDEIGGEAGDLLMNLCLIARIAEDAERFSMAGIAEAVSDKLIRRHPHVFGDARAEDAAGALSQWEAVKQQEREGGGEEDRSALSGVPRALPALLRAFRVGQKAAGVGFDWPEARGPLDKIEEEFAELRAEIEAAETDPGSAEPGPPKPEEGPGSRSETRPGSQPSQIAEEFGDLLFALVNLARHLDLDPETALRATIERFETRFRGVERRLGSRLGEATLEEMEQAWEQAKAEEGRRGPSENRRDSDG